MTEPARFRLDDVRRLATALGTAVGLPPARATGLAGHLLFYDAAGASSHGIARLPDWLERLAGRSVDPMAEATITSERAGTVVLDARNGVGPVVLARAGELAIEKARDTGLGLVRVANLGPSGPAAHATAEMAVGPVIGLALGPGPSTSVALPCEGGLPAVYDSALGGTDAEALARQLPWAAILAPEGHWLIVAIGVRSLEPLATFHERIHEALITPGNSTACLEPAAWDTHRRAIREHGVAVDETVRSALTAWAERFGVTMPEPVPLRT